MTRKFGVAVQVLGSIGLALASVPLLAGCFRKAPTDSQRPVPEVSAGAVRVETLPVTVAEWQRVSEATPAELLPYETTDLYAKVSGYVQEIRVDYGDRVQKGDLLALLSAPEMDKEGEQKKALVARAEAAIQQAQEAVKAVTASLRSAQASVVEAEAGRMRAHAQYERWKTQYANVEELVRRQVIDGQTRDETLHQFKAAEATVQEVEAKIQSAKAILDESQAKLDQAQADVRVAEAQRHVAQADRDYVEAMLQYTRIVAPYDGVVTRRNLHTGAFLHSGSTQPPLLTVVRTDRLRLVVDVPEKDVPYLDKDDLVQVNLDALPGRQLTWRISRLAPVLGAGKKVRVEADVPNPEGTLYPGMYGRAAVILEVKPQALTVPVTCLGQDPKGAFVWLVVDGRAKQARVQLGLHDGKKAEITAGLSGTEEVIGHGKENLREGQPVLAQRAGARGGK